MIRGQNPVWAHITRAGFAKRFKCSSCKTEPDKTPTIIKTPMRTEACTVCLLTCER